MHSNMVVFVHPELLHVQVKETPKWLVILRSLATWPALANKTHTKYRFATEVWDSYPKQKKEYVFLNQTCQIMGSLDMKGREGIWFFMDAKYDDYFGRITKLEIQAYMDKEAEILKHLGKIPSQQEIFKSNLTFFIFST